MKTYQVPPVNPRVRLQWTHVTVTQYNRVIATFSSPAIARWWIKENGLKEAVIKFVR